MTLHPSDLSRAIAMRLMGAGIADIAARFGLAETIVLAALDAVTPERVETVMLRMESAAAARGTPLVARQYRPAPAPMTQAEMWGDPPPGRSALDSRMGVG